MSILSVRNGPPLWDLHVFRIGQALVKRAEDPAVSYNLSGTLQLVESGWIMLSVPNALVRGVFAAMDEPGIELPYNKFGALVAHISVMRPEEVEALGGGDKITERGKRFTYTLGRLYSVPPGSGMTEMERVWFIRVHSPDLQNLRRSYGLSSLPNDGKYDFHITVAARKKGVLGRNETKKTVSVA
jgi:hypothetical protein